MTVFNMVRRGTKWYQKRLFFNIEIERSGKWQFSIWYNVIVIAVYWRITHTGCGFNFGRTPGSHTPLWSRSRGRRKRGTNWLSYKDITLWSWDFDVFTTARNRICYPLITMKAVTCNWNNISCWWALWCLEG